MAQLNNGTERGEKGSRTFAKPPSVGARAALRGPVAGTLGDVAWGCMSSPFATLTAAALSDAFARDWADLGARFIAATGVHPRIQNSGPDYCVCRALLYLRQKRSAPSSLW